MVEMYLEVQVVALSAWIDGEDYGGGSAGIMEQSGNGGDGRGPRIIWDNSNTRVYKHKNCKNWFVHRW